MDSPKTPPPATLVPPAMPSDYVKDLDILIEMEHAALPYRQKRQQYQLSAGDVGRYGKAILQLPPSMRRVCAEHLATKRKLMQVMRYAKKHNEDVLAGVQELLDISLVLTQPYYQSRMTASERKWVSMFRSQNRREKKCLKKMRGVHQDCCRLYENQNLRAAPPRFFICSLCALNDTKTEPYAAYEIVKCSNEKCEFRLCAKCACQLAEPMDCPGCRAPIEREKLTESEVEEWGEEHQPVTLDLAPMDAMHLLLLPTFQPAASAAAPMEAGHQIIEVVSESDDESTLEFSPPSQEV